MNYFRINLAKVVQVLYTESYKILLQQIKEHLNKCRDTCSMIGRINIVKMIVLSILIHRIKAIPVKILVDFFFFF